MLRQQRTGCQEEDNDIKFTGNYAIRGVVATTTHLSCISCCIGGQTLISHHYLLLDILFFVASTLRHILNIKYLFFDFMIQSYSISSEARTNVLLNFAKSQQMKAKDNFLLSSFAFSPVKSYHRNSMIFHGRKGETETKCLRIVYADMKKALARNL